MPEKPRTPSAPAAKWSAGAIRITSRTAAAGISRRLGLAADEHYSHTDSGLRPTTVWIRRSGLPDDSDLADHVRVPAALPAPRREELAGLSADCGLELVLGFGSENGQGGCVLPGPLLAEVGALGLDLVLDLYPPDTTAAPAVTTTA
ncbi:hypothetical protein ACFY4H_24955 [Streptomyces althioticus]|uniref:hypothetical protein n=1 Tax=Streptomyces althioticus TaxID=83380 RepID=UPI0036BB02DE